MTVELNSEFTASYVLDKRTIEEQFRDSWANTPEGRQIIEDELQRACERLVLRIDKDIIDRINYE